MAQSRPRKLNKQGQESYREELASIGLIQEISRTIRYLAIGWVPEFSQPGAEEGPCPMPRIVGYRLADKTDLTRLSHHLRSCTQLLGKLLPDLKAIEVSDLSPSQQPDLSEAELARRLAAVLASSSSSSSSPSPSPRSSQGQSQTLANLPDKVPPAWLN